MSRGLGDVYKRQGPGGAGVDAEGGEFLLGEGLDVAEVGVGCLAAGVVDAGGCRAGGGGELVGVGGAHGAVGEPGEGAGVVLVVEVAAVGEAAGGGAVALVGPFADAVGGEAGESGGVVGVDLGVFFAVVLLVVVFFAVVVLRVLVVRAMALLRPAGVRGSGGALVRVGRSVVCQGAARRADVAEEGGAAPGRPALGSAIGADLPGGTRREARADGGAVRAVGLLVGAVAGDFDPDQVGGHRA